MGLFLQILGAIFLILIAYVLFRVAILVGKAVIILYAVKKIVTEAGKGVGPSGPPQVSLVEVSGARWEDGETAALAAPLPALGFQEVGFFDLDVMGGTRLQGWVHPGQGVYAVVYQGPQAGTWMDFVTMYEDGSSLTFSNSPHGDGSPIRAGQEIRVFPGLGAEALYRKMLAERPDRPTRHLATTDFRADFERAYAEGMAGRGGTGGFSPDQISPAAALAGVMTGRFSGDQVRQIRESMTLKMYQAVAQGLSRAYREQSGLSDEEWGRVGGHLVYVWDSMNADAFHSLLPSWKGHADFDRLQAGMVAEDGEDTGRRAFAAENAALPEGLRYVKVGEVSTGTESHTPLTADVYAPPHDRTVAGGTPSNLGAGR